MSDTKTKVEVVTEAVESDGRIIFARFRYITFPSGKKVQIVENEATGEEISGWNFPQCGNAAAFKLD